MEDELGSIYATIVASLADMKAITTTASVGYNYMQKGIWYVIAMGTPIIVVDVMRLREAEQATQSDIMHARWSESRDQSLLPHDRGVYRRRRHNHPSGSGRSTQISEPRRGCPQSDSSSGRRWQRTPRSRLT